MRRNCRTCHRPVSGRGEKTGLGERASWGFYQQQQHNATTYSAVPRRTAFAREGKTGRSRSRTIPGYGAGECVTVLGLCWWHRVCAKAVMHGGIRRETGGRPTGEPGCWRRLGPVREQSREREKREQIIPEKMACFTGASLPGVSLLARVSDESGVTTDAMLTFPAPSITLSRNACLFPVSNQCSDKVSQSGLSKDAQLSPWYHPS